MPGKRSCFAPAYSTITICLTKVLTKLTGLSYKYALVNTLIYDNLQQFLFRTTVTVYTVPPGVEHIVLL